MALRPSAARPEKGSRTPEPRQQTLAQQLLIRTIGCYRYLISPALPPRCRFLPTCSGYALEAVEQHGALRGGWLALRRVARCHPLGGSGLDPVPPRRAAADSRL